MAYSINYFQPNLEDNNSLQPRCFVNVINNKVAFMTNGVPNTYLPNVLSQLLIEKFNSDPYLFTRDNLTNLSFLDNIKSSFYKETEKEKNKLSQEQLYILDNQYAKNPKSGISFISIWIEKDKIHYNMLGDNFLFIYNNETKKLSAYCSMIDKQGQLILAQPCHCLFNDLTFLGSPIKGEKNIKNCICFVMSKDLAGWFIENYKTNQEKTITILTSLSSNDKYKELLTKIQSQQLSKGQPFNEYTASCIIISENDEDNNQCNLNHMISWCKEHEKIIITLIISLIAGIIILGVFMNDKDNKKDKKETIEANKQPKDKITVNTKSSSITNSYNYYHAFLQNKDLSFSDVRKMKKKADDELLKNTNALLYDTISVYYNFVNLYNVAKDKEPRLRMALSELFTNDKNGQYTILDNNSNKILSTNLTTGKIFLLNKIHRKIIIEMFIGKYTSEDNIVQHTNIIKSNNYRKAVNNCSVWNSFAEMK